MVHISDMSALRDAVPSLDVDGRSRSGRPLALDFGSRSLAIEPFAIDGEDREKRSALGESMQLGNTGEKKVVLEYDYESGLAHPRWSAASLDNALGGWELELSRVFDNVHAFLVYQEGPVVWFTSQWRQAATNVMKPISPTGLAFLLPALVVKPV